MPSNGATVSASWRANRRRVQRQRRTVRATGSTDDGGIPDFMPAQVRDIEEGAAIDAMKRIERVPLDVPGDGRAVASFIGPKTRLRGDRTAANVKLIMLHGFDSSCLEFRRLMPALERRLSPEVDVFALDILGWGFSCIERPTIGDYGPETKRRYISEFISTVVKANTNTTNNNKGDDDKVVLLGASLGGAAAIDFAVEYPQLVDRLILIDAQGYIDGVGEMATMPDFLSKLGLNVLKSWPLRSYANRISYSDPVRFATADAVRVGKLHCEMDTWLDASLSFMKSGGFRVTDRVPEVACETLIIWGRDDKILDGPKFASKFEEDIRECTLEWVEGAGHVPHLEKPDVTSALIEDFLKPLLSSE